MNDQKYLREAIELKRQSAEPAPCACIIVMDGRVVARTVNSQREDGAALNHAEIKAVYEANLKTGQRKLHGAVVYCSCEPCVLCLSALSLAEVDRIVFDERMKDIAADNPLSQLDSTTFVANYFKKPPKLERQVLS